MRLTSLLGNGQRLDGGAMFGNVPREMWSRWAPPDERGRIELACRAFLLEEAGQRALFEAGIGAFFDAKMRERFGVTGDGHGLLESLARGGVAPDDIDVVVLSHLHFDHAGGLLSAFRADHEFELVFPRATFVVGERALERARRPHPRDRASFIPELLPLLDASGRLHVVPEGAEFTQLLGERVRLRSSEGHTPGMRLAEMRGAAATAVFCADLVPGRAWVHLPVTMGYDRAPEQLIDEKKEFYESLGVGGWLLFTHDVDVAAGRLRVDDRGRYGTEGSIGEFVDWDLDVDDAPTSLTKRGDA